MRGAIDVDLPESVFQFDDGRSVQSLSIAKRYTSHKIVEEMMIMANRCTAQCLIKAKVPGIFRVHDSVATDSLKILTRTMNSFGVRRKSIKADDLSDIVKLIQTQPNLESMSNVLQISVLSSLPQAYYSEDNIGHFGLALKEYSHFTSPIRRYADLLAHRLIKDMVARRDDGVLYSESLSEEVGRPHLLESTSAICSAISSQQRVAEGVTKDVRDLLICQLMSKHIGEVFDAVVVSVVPFGVFVEIEGWYVKGLIHVSELGNEYYVFDDQANAWSATNGDNIRLCDKLRVKLKYVNFELGALDFSRECEGTEAATDNSFEKRKGKRKKSKKKKAN